MNKYLGKFKMSVYGLICGSNELHERERIWKKIDW